MAQPGVDPDQLGGPSYRRRWLQGEARKRVMGEAATNRSEDSRTILEHLRRPVVAAMLYGSAARGDSNPQSDVDVLQIVPYPTSPYDVGAYSIATYTATHLGALAKAGSLFVAHLKLEGIVLDDPDRVLAGILEQYQTPDSYKHTKQTIRTAAQLLDVDPALFDRNRTGFVRVALFLLRTWLYVKAAESGPPKFSMREVEAQLGLENVARLFLRRTAEAGSWEYFKELRESLSCELGSRIANTHGTLEALIVSKTGQSPLTASLGIRLLAGEHPISYDLMDPGAIW